MHGHGHDDGFKEFNTMGALNPMHVEEPQTCIDRMIACIMRTFVKVLKHAG